MPRLVEDKIDRYRLREDILEKFLKEKFPAMDPTQFQITVSKAMDMCNPQL